ncbi:MAG: hypothetical protein OEO20_03295 [Gemmatimonadota bacterium]|nr:hypothetical protein [Gemmatimonadota bacterium]MDH3477309.1 hypothetical protein [Gemmatimonadota bacterium]MDH3571510.1 hypothetical protein [Gemmatimonadota bacterium]MDH5550664.1 hypothetical protein [Gemmatimonadota bacterium]
MMSSRPNDGSRLARASAMLVATALAVGACGDAAAPGDFDAVQTNQAALEALGPFAGNPAIEAMGLLTTAMPDFGAAPVAPAMPAADGMPIPENLRLLTQVAPFLSPTQPAVIFPADLLGKTLVYNGSTGKYEVAPDSTTAPAIGIRLILYAVDPIFHQPIDPLTQVGYLELTDEGTPAADRLGAIAVVNGITYLEYLASAVVTTSSLTFTAEGYLSDGTTQVDFSLSHTWSQVDGFHLSYAIDVPSKGVGLTVTANLDPQSEMGTYELTVYDGGSSVVLSVQATPTSLTGSVTHGGNVVVKISGTPENPVFTDGADNPLTAEQVQALGELFNSVGAVIDGFDDLLIPAYLVLQVSIGA